MRRLLGSGAIALLSWSFTPAADPAAIGQIKTATEPVSILRGDARVAAAIGDAVYEKDVVETGTGGKVGITLSDNTMLSVGPESRLALDTFRFDSAALKGNLLANMQRGTLAVTTGDIARSAPDAMKIQTPSAVLGVRGTDFLVRVVER
jgi:hypothetical protein